MANDFAGNVQAFIDEEEKRVTDRVNRLAQRLLDVSRSNTNFFAEVRKRTTDIATFTSEVETTLSSIESRMLEIFGDA